MGIIENAQSETKLSKIEIKMRKKLKLIKSQIGSEK